MKHRYTKHTDHFTLVLSFVSIHDLPVRQFSISLSLNSRPHEGGSDRVWVLRVHKGDRIDILRRDGLGAVWSTLVPD